ncbi:dihydrofolate reductase family protein [Actinomadura madurae]|uniref:dihydrofolate reductase family protein n=1 Tax=Actinomadura madurae TaxID=1993 RepID=UPI0020D214D8|nr:dihydrofolate reductase family protein [Actinomadura madurae]MCP9968537.1 dihydrofolate reductase family protein [Actinomadura madurae]
MSTTFTVDFFCSLDGYGMAHGWPGYWGKEGPEIREDRVRTFAQEQVLVFGATTFREFREFVVEYDEPYYDSLNELPKIVFSSTLEEPLGWQNSTVLNEDAVTAIERLKRTTDVPMRSHGSISLNRALLAAGLVDRLEVIMFPAISGRAGDRRSSTTELSSTWSSSSRPCSTVGRTSSCTPRTFTARSPRVSGRDAETWARSQGLRST